jgi:uncharacterized protein YbjT (DUF2867 family)
MVFVAVAGGTSPGLGRAVLEALLDNASHTPIVLSRSSSKTPQWLQELGVEVRKVDYQSEESLVHALQGVHTASMSLNTQSTGGLPAQSQLIRISRSSRPYLQQMEPGLKPR